MTTRNTKTTLSVSCPRCSARPGKPCRSERIGSPNALGGGWGGFLDCERPHAERSAAAREQCTADVLVYVAAHADMTAKSIRVSVGWNAATVRNVLAALVADGRIVCKSTTGRDDVFEVAAPVAPAAPVHECTRCDAPLDADTDLCDACANEPDPCECDAEERELDALESALDEILDSAPVAAVADDMPSDDDFDAAVRRALVVECSFAELFAALDRELFGGNADGMLDDMLDESLTRLIDAGVVDALDTPSEPGMLSRRTYALADRADPAADESPEPDMSDADREHAATAIREVLAAVPDGMTFDALRAALGYRLGTVSTGDFAEALGTLLGAGTVSRMSGGVYVVSDDEPSPDPVESTPRTVAALVQNVRHAVVECSCVSRLEIARRVFEPRVPTNDDMRALDAALRVAVDAGEIVMRGAGAVPRYYAPRNTPTACCSEPCVRGGRCENCGTWLADLDDVSRAVLANLSPPVASALPTDRESRVAASRAIQGALACNRSAVRSTAKGTAAPFAGVVLSTEQAGLVATRLRILDALLADDEPAVQDALARALSAATR